MTLFRSSSHAFTFVAASCLAATAAHADIIHGENVILDSSGVAGNSADRMCIGDNCVDGEVFSGSFVKLRLKDESVSLQFEDVNDASWEIIANPSSLNDSFNIRESGANTMFSIEGGAPSNSFYIADDGNIGLGTSLPGRNLHIVDGLTAGVILEYDGTNGGSPKSWDINGNGESFRITELGAAAAFRIRTPSVLDTMVLQNGKVGINTFAPTEALHIKRSDGQAKILVEETGGGGAQELFQMKSNGGSYFTLSNTNSGRDWFFTHENAAQGRFIITSSTNASQGMFLDPDGDLQIGGTLTENSDKNAKMAIVPVDASAILDKVAELPVSMWTYKDDTSGARHVGPMAQDFYAAFGLGATETGIATLDTSGVALASIKALHSELEGAHSTIEQLNGQLQTEASRNDAQAELIATLTARLDALGVE
ncbi:MAG: tail fiber domain-containing protein [Roseovarius sp.]|nr:tail fiber domain-containing protein [Roseovarius sp.]